MCVSRLHQVVAPGPMGHVLVEDSQGHEREVSLLAFEGATPQPGEWLVVHSGFALERVDSAEAAAIVAELRRAAGPPPGEP
jgi:hydrogenase maturation factor